ncbi:MAG: hypothetical protein PF447_11665, partial [Spirochaetaceae bacterium]|nr:hypothetical protein [Spirochaetaceae bacterium]
MIPYYKIKDVLTQDLGKYMQLQISPRNGGFSEERKTIHFPSMTELKIHSINLDTMVSAVRGIARKKLKPGDLLLPADWAGQWTKKVFLYSPKRGFDQGKTKLIKS